MTEILLNVALITIIPEFVRKMWFLIIGTLPWIRHCNKQYIYSIIGQIRFHIVKYDRYLSPLLHGIPSVKRRNSHIWQDDPSR